MSEKYSGWSNYETWAVNTWMDNEESSHVFWLERAAEQYDQAEEEKYLNKRQVAIRNLAGEFQEAHEKSATALFRMAKQDEGSVFTDLLHAAMGHVDWHEIAESWIDVMLENRAHARKKVVKESTENEIETP